MVGVREIKLGYETGQFLGQTARHHIGRLSIGIVRSRSPESAYISFRLSKQDK